MEKKTFSQRLSQVATSFLHMRLLYGFAFSKSYHASYKQVKILENTNAMWKIHL